MTDLPSSLGIEAVECVAEGGSSVTVRVTGRWRRRRPELRGQAMLVVETDAGRRRFPAMPEPPSLTGAAPGTWRMSFTLPAGLAPGLPGRTFLQLGGVMVALPIGEVVIASEASGPEGLEDRFARGPDRAAESARVRAAELGADVERLERELDEARGDSARLRDAIADRDRRLRAADQHVHAERGLRGELEQELARQTRAARHDLRALHDRVADLERELVRMRRAVDEAQHLAAAAGAARAEAERRLAERSPPVAEPARVGEPLRAALSLRELELQRTARAGTPAAAGPARPVQWAGDGPALRLETSMISWRGQPADARVAVLERELAAAREEIEVQRRGNARAYAAIELVRGELRQLRPSAPPPQAGVAAPPPVGPSAPPPPAPATVPVRLADPPAPRSAVQAERLSEALTRLRERTPAQTEGDSTPPSPPESAPTESPSPARPANPWLERPFRALATDDPTAAGRLLLALLPAQRAADPQAVAYDLVLGDLICARVTVGSGTIHVELADAARPSVEVDFQLVGDLARVARLLAAGPLRRRLPSRRRARVRGDRRRVAALDHLMRARLTLGELIVAGFKLDPLLTLTLAARAVDASWTAGERFTIGHRDPAAAAPGAYLYVRDAKPPLVSTELPHGPVTTVVACPADEFLGVLAGREASVEGEERPLTLVRQWLDRAQCG